MTFVIEMIGRSFCCVLFEVPKGADPTFAFSIMRLHSVSRRERRWIIINADIRWKQVEEIINQEKKLQLSSMQMIRIV